MTDSELIVLFALAMLAMALVAIAVDWLGKPIHRRFVPKIFRYADELAPPADPTRTGWSDDTFAVPENPPDDQPIAFLDGSTEWTSAALVIPAPDEATGTTPLFDQFASDADDDPPLFDQFAPDTDDDPPHHPDATEHPDAATIADAPEGDGTETTADASPIDHEPAAVGATRAPVEAGDPTPRRTADAPSRRTTTERGTGWRPGQFVFNLTRDGNEPSPEVIRRRFWRNIAASDHVSAFGATNAERLAAGKAPSRHNPRRGSTETMRLPVASFTESGGRPPAPSWPDDDVDPYAS